MLLRNHVMMMPQKGGVLREDDGPCVYETNIEGYCNAFDPTQGYYWIGVDGMPAPFTANELFTAYAHECQARVGNLRGLTVDGYNYFSGFRSGWSTSNRSTGIYRVGAFDYFSGESLAGCPKQGEGWGWGQVNWDDVDYSTGIFYPGDGAHDYLDYAPRDFIGYPNDLIGGEGWGEAWREAFIDTGLRAYDLFDYELVSNVSACEEGLGFLNPWTDDNSAFGIRSDDDLQGYTVGEVVGGFGLSWGEGWGGTWQVL